MKYIKTYENKETPKPKFKVGDEVMVVYDLTQYGRPPYGIVAGDMVTITRVMIYSNGTISYTIDSPKVRKIKKGIDTRYDYFPEFHFDYEWNISAKKYNL